MMQFAINAAALLCMFSLAGGITFLVVAWKLRDRPPAQLSKAGEVLREHLAEARKVRGDEASRRAHLGRRES